MEIRTFCKDIGCYLLGILVLLLAVILLVLSIPVYVYRVVAIVTTKICCADFDSIVGGQSSCFVSDLLSNPAPRSNIVAATVWEGEITLENLKQRVLEKWIQSDLKKYKRFQQHPVKWMGFYFWKNDVFSIDHHIHLFTGQDVVDVNKLNQYMENHLNARFPLERSPWQIYLIPRYYNESREQSEFNRGNSKGKTVLIFKWHHSLTDGIGFLDAFKECFSESNNTPSVTASNRSRFTPIKALGYAIAFPVNVLLHLPDIFSRQFKKSPYKVANSDKTWYQLLARTKPISIQTIKSIKNTLHVSFASVLLSAISKAINEDMNKCDKNVVPFHPGLCLCALPMPKFGRSEGLTNHFAGALLDLPVSEKNLSSKQRLQSADQTLKTIQSTILPIELFLYGTLIGWHLHYASRYLSEQGFCPIVLTNFAGLPSTLKFQNSECTQIFAAAGAMPGIAGIIATVVTHDQEVTVYLSVEKSLMSKEKAANLVTVIEQEIDNLAVLVTL